MSLKLTSLGRYFLQHVIVVKDKRLALACKSLVTLNEEFIPPENVPKQNPKDSSSSNKNANTYFSSHAV